MALALGWVALGLAIAIGGWRMDRLANLNIEPWSAPGLVPGLLGVLMVLFGATLAWRESRRGAASDDGAGDGANEEAGTVRRAIPILVLAGVFVVGTLGRGLPFVATSSLTVFAWIVLLRRAEWRASGTTSRGAATAALIAVVACSAIAFLFEDVFLVRLP